MTLRSSLLLSIVAVLLAAGCSRSAEAPAAAGPQGAPRVLLRAEDVPAWAVPYGAEFWRARAAAPRATAPGAELDLEGTLERVSHAFAAHEGTVRSEARTHTTSVQGGTLRFVPHARDGAHAAADATLELSLRSVRRGDVELVAGAAQRRDAFAIGNVLQQQLGTSRIVEHVEARAEGTEVTWVLPEAPRGTGALRLQLDVAGLAYAGRTEAGHHYADAAGVARTRISDAVLHDAAGQRWELPLQPEPGALALVVPADILAAATYPLAIDPVVSAEYGTDSPVAGRLAAYGWSNRLACGGGTCLVTWYDYRTGRYQVRASRFDPATGTVLDPAGIALTEPGTSDSYAPSVVFDGTHFVVAYEGNGTGIFLQTLSTAGAKVGDAVSISTSGSNPVIALGGGRLAVAWNAYGSAGGYELRGAILQAGTVVTTNVLLRQSANQVYPTDVAFDGTGFAVAFSEYGASGYDVGRLRLGTSGALLDAPVMVAATTLSEESPSVCSTGSGALYVWSNGNRPTAQRLDAAFNAVGAPFALTTGTGAQPACATAGSQYLVVWDTGRNRVDANTGALLDGAAGLSHATAGYPRLAFDGTRFVSAFRVRDAASGNDELFLRRISTANALVDATPILGCTPGNGQTRPVVAFDGTNYLLVWADHRTTGVMLRGARLSDAGTLLDPGGLTLSSTASATGATVAYGGGRYLVAWQDPATRRLVAVRVSTAGVVEDATPRALSAATAQEPSLAFDGTRFVAAWTNASSYAVEANTMTPAGAVGTQLAVAPATNSGGSPQVACIQNGRCAVLFLANWGTTGRDLHLVRLQGGALLDTSPWPVDVGPEWASQPLVATDGDTFLVTYQGATRVGRRIRQDATLVDAAPFTLNAGGNSLAFDGRNYTLVEANGWYLYVTQVSPTGTTPSVSRFQVVQDSGGFGVPDIVGGPTARRSLVVYDAYDPDPAVQNRRVRARFVSFTEAPRVSSTTRSTPEDTARSVPLSAWDGDGDPVTYGIVTQPEHGTLSGTLPNLVYTPHADFHGTDAFTWKASDGERESTATVTLTVTPVNDAPVATAAAVQTNEDVALSLTLVGTDVDGNALTYTVLTPPTLGTLSGTAPDLTYTPTPDAHGEDAFTFRVSDGQLTSTATVNITVRPAEDAPVAAALSATVAEDGAVELTLAGSDGDGDTLGFRVVSGPAHGTLSGTPPALTYAPAPNYAGPDVFTFVANDGDQDSAPATVSLTVTPVNDAPVAVSSAATTDEGTAVAVTLAGTDVDGDALEAVVVDGPAHGRLSGTAPDLVYTPEGDFHGSDAFTFRVSDGSASSALATVSLTVRPVNDAPVASAQSVDATEDAEAAVTLGGTDVDGDALTFTVTTLPAHGTLRGTPPDLTYVPEPNFHGTDTFTFTASDAALTSAQATVHISVAPANDAPVAAAQAVSVAEDGSVAVALSGTDVDGDALTYAVVSGPAHGTLQGTAPNLTYVPAANFHGTDSFTFEARDASAASAPAAVSVTVVAGNDVPVADAQSLTTPEDAALTLTLGGRDVEGDALTFTVLTQPAHGTLSGTPPQLTYTPDADYHGADAFTFEARDGQVASAAATVELTVSPVNDAPVALPQALTLRQGEELPVTLAGTDVDGDTLTYVVVGPPDAGTLSGTGHALTYSAPAGFRGQTGFTFKVSDGSVDSTVAAVSLTVSNGAPTVTAAAELLQPVEGQAVRFSATAADPGGDVLTFAWDFGDGASAMDREPTHTYVDQGEFTVTVTVSDGLETATATLTLQVQNGAPSVVPAAQTVSGDEGAELAFEVAASDPGTSDTWTAVWSWGDGTPDSEGARASHTYADDGVYTVTVAVTDKDGAVTRGTREVTVGNVPPTPAQQATLKGTAGDTLRATLQATDRAGARDPLTWTLVEGPGTLSPEGAYTWASGVKEEGSFVVRARVSDDEGGSAESVFTVELAAAPVTDVGCGCSSGGGGAALWMGALGLVLLRRRRRRS